MTPDITYTVQLARGSDVAQGITAPTCQSPDGRPSSAVSNLPFNNHSHAQAAVSAVEARFVSKIVKQNQPQTLSAAENLIIPIDIAGDGDLSEVSHYGIGLLFAQSLPNLTSTSTVE